VKTKTSVKAKTKQKFLDAFWKIYKEKRIERISIKEICQIAGYNRSTFYEYFIDIYDVLEQIEDKLIPTKELLPPINIMSKKFGVPLEIFLKIYEENSEFYSVLLGDNGDPSFATKLKNSTKKLLKEEIQEDIKMDSANLDYLLEYVLSAMIGIMSYWFKSGKTISLNELISLITLINERGISDIIHKD